MSYVAIVPQEIEVAAPLYLVFTLVSTADYGYRPSARYTQRLVRREAHRLVLEVVPLALTHLPSTQKELLAYPPDRISYRHLSGPFTGAIEELVLRPTAASTLLILGARFFADDGMDHRVRKLRLEHEVREHLLEVKAAAEQRAGARAVREVVLPWEAPLPLLKNEPDLQQAAEAQEEEEFGHSGHATGVARVAMGLALGMGFAAGQVEQLRRAALLHDVGKIALDSTLWGSRGTLSSGQRRLMEAHVRFGYELASRAGIVEEVVAAILHHHERWDGQGYPEHLSGEDIPLTARLLFVAEVIDSMLRASYRRQPMTPAQVADVIEAGAGRQWDPNLARQAARMLRGQS